jgi:preprotein translocase subunit SecF
MSKRRDRRLKAKKKAPVTEKLVVVEKKPSAPRSTAPPWLRWYDVHYKKLLIIPFLLVILAIAQIGFQYTTTGDFVNRGITLKGGISITILQSPAMDADGITSLLLDKFPDNEVVVRNLDERGVRKGILVESDANTVEAKDKLVDEVKALFPEGLESEDISVESTGSVLGEDFFKQITVALIIAFIFMGIVVFIFFRNFVPSLAIILAILFDIIVTVAIVNLTGIKLSTAGVAAFLMLVGYSVDTNILLSTKVLKRKGGTVFKRIIGAAKTGFMMTLTTLVALTIALFATESQVIAQIMTILIIGLLVDLVNTWIQNAGILRLYLAKKGEK